MQRREIGSVICTPDGPNSTTFSFVVTNATESIPVRKGHFVELGGEEGKTIGMVTEIIKTNRYFERAESVKEYERGAPLKSIFPIDRWEYVIANVRLMGVHKSTNGQFSKVDFPPSPGDKVY